MHHDGLASRSHHRGLAAPSATKLARTSAQDRDTMLIAGHPPGDPLLENVE